MALLRIKVHLYFHPSESHMVGQQEPLVCHDGEELSHKVLPPPS